MTTGAFLAALLIAGCGSQADSSGDPRDKTQAADVVQRYINTDNCQLMSRRYLEESYPDAPNPIAECQSDPYNGLLAGQYRLGPVEVDGDSATVTVIEDSQAKRIYRLVRQNDRWLINGVATTAGRTQAQLGQTLYSSGVYETDGKPNEANLSITVVSVGPASSPDQYISPKAGSRFWKAKVKVRSRSKLPFLFDVTDLALLMDGGARYTAEGYPFEPSLGNCCTEVAAGDALSGFASFQVPKREKKALAVQFSPAADENGPYKWNIR